jgi:hypothetical protein
VSGWVRLWSDMPTDPKWRVIAKASGQRIGDVIAVFNMLMVEGGSAAEKGCITGLHDEDIAAALDMEESEISAIKAAMEGRVTLNGFLKGWIKRQPKREDDSSKRVAEHRERLKSAESSQNKPVTHCNAPDTEADTDKEIEESIEATPQLRTAVLPVADAAQIWNENAAEVGWPTVRRLSDPRKSALRARLREEGLDGWAAAISRARASPYLGRDPPAWFTFDWIAKPANFLKLIEGNYDRNRQPVARQGHDLRGSRPSTTLDMLEEATDELSGSGSHSGDYRTARASLSSFGPS